MANVTTWLRAIVVATVIISHAGPSIDHSMAQGNGARDDRGDPGERNGRRGRRRDRNAEGERRPDEDRPAEGSAAAPAVAPTTSNSFGTVSDAERIRQSATETIEKDDKNSNGILEGDELGKLGMSRGADLNGDGKITHNELVEFRTPKSTGAPDAKPDAPTQDGNQAASTEPVERKIVNTDRKSYRFRSAKDRLKELQPSWSYANRDTNGDGQVSMSEYSRSWSDRTAAEFRRIDRDNDGMITSEEAR